MKNREFHIYHPYYNKWLDFSEKQWTDHWEDAATFLSLETAKQIADRESPNGDAIIYEFHARNWD